MMPTSEVVNADLVREVALDTRVLMPAGVAATAVATIGEEPSAHQTEENVHIKCNLPHHLAWRENPHGGYANADASRPEVHAGGMRAAGID